MFDINDPSVYDDNYTVLSKIRKLWRAIKDLISRVTTLENKPDYSLPTATTDRLGGIKVGQNLSVEADGTLNATGGGGGYELPPATTSTLGGIIVGDNLSIDENGRLSGQAGGGSSVTPSSSTPVMDGVGSAGSSTEYARGDHIHPSQLIEVTQAQYDALVLAGTVNPNVDYHITDAGSEGYIQNINATASISGTTGTPAVTVTKSGTNANPTFAFAFSNLKGADGQDGTDGTDGTDGISPTITVRSITGGNQIEIVSAGGTERFDVMDGTDGQDGAGLVDYSTSEQDTGLKWIDGKSIYQKSFAFTVPTYTSGDIVWEVVSNSIIANIDKAIYMEAWYEDSNNLLYNFENVYAGSGNGGAIHYNKNNGITVGNSQASHNGRTGYVTLKYTKTTT